MGQSLDQFIPARFREGHRAHVDKLGKTGVTSRRMGALGALSGVRADGEEFPIEAAISHMEASGRKLYTVILRDITERKRAEEALRQSEGLLSAVLKQLPVGLGVMDMNGQWIVTNGLMEEFVPKAIPSTLPERIGRWRAYDADGQLVPRKTGRASAPCGARLSAPACKCSSPTITDKTGGCG